MTVPHGLPALLQAYGNPFDFVNDKPAWESKILLTRPLRYPLPYAYGPATVTQIRAHRQVVDRFVEVLAKCVEAGVDPQRIAYGGCYCWRPKRGGSVQLSVHTWGAAMDLDPAHNPMGIPWDGGDRMLQARVVEIAESFGLLWGGRWARPDSMHVQLVDGY